MAILDVRDDLRQGREPFTRIMQTVDGLGPDESLELVVPFEPAPLYMVMERRGFSHRAKQTPDGDWRVVFSREKGD